MTSIIPENRNHWLQLKAQDISSTEVAALFNMSPYLTKYELFHIKKEKAIVEIEDNERMKWGRRLEAEIAKGFAEDHGLVIRKKDEYMRHSECERMGASFDYEIAEILPFYQIKTPNKYQQAYKELGDGILEIKKVDSLIYRQQWQEDEAPAHIEFQVQQQMAVSGLKWCVIAPLVGGNELKPILRLYNPEMALGIRNAISEFYLNIAANNPPAPDYARDAEFIINLYKKAGQNVYIPGGDSLTHLEQMCQQYKEAGIAEANAADIKKILKAKILEMAGHDAGSAITPNWKLNLGEVKASLGTMVTADMLGTVINARAGYRMLRITENKGK